jgi:hypothetical protein
MQGYSLPIRNEMMVVRQRRTILLVASLFPVGVCFHDAGTAMNPGLVASMGTAPLIVCVQIARIERSPAPPRFTMLCATLKLVGSVGMKHARGGGCA